MVLVETKPTRSPLLQPRRIRRTAERGHRLLKLKQDALVVEFFRVLERARQVRSNLVDKYRVAEQRIAIARAIEGSIGVKSAAFAPPGNPPPPPRAERGRGAGDHRSTGVRDCGDAPTDRRGRGSIREPR